MIEILFAVFEPLAYPFMIRATLMSVSIGVICAIFSCFLVLKGWALIGDAVSHAVLPGLALAYLFGLPLFLGALISGIVCAIGIGWIKNNSRVKEDAVMGIIFSGFFAFGLILITQIKTDVHLLHILFGNVLGIGSADLFQAGIIALLIGTILLCKHRDLMLYCFDPIQAKISGLSVPILHFGLLLLLSLTIVSSIKTAGILLVIAMLIAPGAIAFLLTQKFEVMLLIAMSVAILSAIIGVLASYHLDVSTAPLIVLLQFSLFLFITFKKSLFKYEHSFSQITR